MPLVVRPSSKNRLVAGELLLTITLAFQSSKVRTPEGRLKLQSMNWTLVTLRISGGRVDAEEMLTEWKTMFEASASGSPQTISGGRPFGAVAVILLKVMLFQMGVVLLSVAGLVAAVLAAKAGLTPVRVPSPNS